MVVADQLGLFVVRSLGQLASGEVLPVGFGADGAGHDALLQFSQYLGVDLRGHELRLDREDHLVRVETGPLCGVPKGLFDRLCGGDDDAVQGGVLVVLPGLASLARFGA